MGQAFVMSFNCSLLNNGEGEEKCRLLFLLNHSSLGMRYKMARVEDVRGGESESTSLLQKQRAFRFMGGRNETKFRLMALDGVLF